MGHLLASTGVLILVVLLGAGCDRSEPPSAPRSGTAAPPPAEAISSPAPSVPADHETAPAVVDEQQGVPATQAPTPAPDVPAFLPLVDARPGEWAEYAALRGRTLRYEVEQVSVALVVTRVVVSDAGKPLGQPATREDLRESDLLARQAELSKATRTAERTRITVGGREREAVLYEDRWVDEEVAYVRRTWVDAGVPVFGIVLMELHGDGQLEARMELLGSSNPR